MLSFLLLTALAAVAHGKRYPITFKDEFSTDPFIQVAVEVGTPSQIVHVTFDSGSSVFWVPASNLTMNGKSYVVEYNPNVSSTAEPQGIDTSFTYDGVSINGPTYTDLAGFDSPSTRQNVTSATFINLPRFFIIMGGIIGMNQGSQFMATYFETQGTPDDQKFFVANFNFISPSAEAWFEIGDSDGADSEFGDPSKCIVLRPKSEEARLVPVTKPELSFTFWWQFDVTKFSIGDKESTGRAEALVDDGTPLIMGNFASIFNPDPVPDSICEYMYKNNVTFDVQFASTDGGSPGVYTLGWEDVTFSDKMYFYDYRESESGCIFSHQPDWPETLIILGLPFYNKHLIKHDYAGDGQVCVTDKSEGYEKLWQSSAPPNFNTASAATKASFKGLFAVAALAITAMWM